MLLTDANELYILPSEQAAEMNMDGLLCKAMESHEPAVNENML